MPKYYCLISLLIFWIQDHWEDQDVGGWTILKWILERCDGAVCTGSIWLRIGTSEQLLWTRQWTFGFHKILGISWVAAQLAASQEGLSSMSEWASDINHRIRFRFVGPPVILPEERGCGVGWGTFLYVWTAIWSWGIPHNVRYHSDPLPSGHEIHFCQNNKLLLFLFETTPGRRKH
jgi:hypothetical protein